MGNGGAPAEESVPGEGPSVSTSAERSPAGSPGVTSPCQSKRHNRGSGEGGRNRVMGKSRAPQLTGFSNAPAAKRSEAIIAGGAGNNKTRRKKKLYIERVKYN